MTRRVKCWATLAILLTALATTASMAAAASWSNNGAGGCKQYYFCTYRVSLGGTVNLSTQDINDDTFNNDPLYSDGYLHNDQVRYASNRFVTGKVYLYQHSYHGTPGWCIGMGANTGLLPYGVSTGASSFKRVAC